jgi:glycerate-2-kinase
VVVLCGGTDGQDGPTDYAGACVTNHTWATAVDNNLNPQQLLENNDSTTLLEQLAKMQLDCLLQPGLTGTNVMDIYMVLW